MAIIDLGKVSITWQGTYAGGTAYTPKDAVYYNGTSYICTANTTGNLPTDTSYWSKMAEGGDVATTLTTQGDILYRDASGLQRLGAGTNGQFLTSGGTGANVSWTTADAGKTLGVTQYSSATRTSLPNQDTYNFFDTNYTQIKANSKLIIDINLIGHTNNNGAVNFDFEYDGTTYSGFGNYTYTAQAQIHSMTYRRMIDGASSTGAKNFKYQYDHATSQGSPFSIWNPNATDDNRLQQTVSTLIITEMDF